MRDAGSHNCDAEDHSGPLDAKDEGTAVVRNVCDYCQTTLNVPEHLHILVRGLASSYRHFLSFVRIYIGMYNTTFTGVLKTKNSEAEGQTVQHMRGLALAPQLHLRRRHTPRGRLCHKNCAPQRNSEEYMFLFSYLSLNIESFRSKVSRIVLSGACEGGSLCVIFDRSVCLLIEMCSD